MALLRIQLNAIAGTAVVAGETLDAAEKERRCQYAATDEIDDQQIDGEAIRCGAQSRRYPEGAQCQQIDDERDEQQGQYKEVYGHLFRRLTLAQWQRRLLLLVLLFSLLLLLQFLFVVVVALVVSVFVVLAARTSLYSFRATVLQST